MKNHLGGKQYMVLVRQAFFNTNSYETLMEEDQIEWYGVKV